MMRFTLGPASFRRESSRKFVKNCHVSGVGFEPTPSFEDQNAWDPTFRASHRELESGALDRSAILTYYISDFL